jgi:hypothetical protein
MTPETPDEWLAYLGKKLDYRHTELLRLHSYVTGNAPLPEGATEVAEAYQRWQRLARTNFANLIVDAVCDRMTIAGFRVGDDTTDNDAARTLWRRSLGDAMAPDVHADMLNYGVGYVMASSGRDGAVLTRESPFATITDHDPLEPMWVRAGLKIWTDQDTDHAVLHLPGRLHRYRRSHHERAGVPLAAGSVAGWEPAGDEETGLDRVPLVRFLNRGGVGEFARHTDLLDRINWVILQRLLIIAMQAFRQRALRKTQESAELEYTDPSTGEQIDYAEMFAPGPDALWDLPYGVEIWESQPGDITQILSAVKDDLRDLGAVTRTPMSVLTPDSANQSAEGAAFAKEGLVFKAGDRINRASPSWDVSVDLGLRLDDLSGPVVTQWLPAERQSLAEKADAAQKLSAGAAGNPILSRRRIITDILGYGADVADQMEAELASETLTTALTSALTTPAEPAATPQADTTQAGV